MSFRDELLTLDACPEALEWVGERTIREAWERCPQGDWLLWWASRSIGRYGITEQSVILAACACAETGLIYAPEGEARPRSAIEAAHRVAEDPSEANRAAAKAAEIASLAALHEAWEAWRAAWGREEKQAEMIAASNAMVSAKAACNAASTAAGDTEDAQYAAWPIGEAFGTPAYQSMADLVRSTITPEWDETVPAGAPTTTGGQL